MTDEQFYTRTFAIVALLALAWLLFLLLSPFFAPLAWAFFIAFLLHPTQEWLARRLHGRSTVTAGLLTAATVAVILGPLAGLGAAFASQVGELLRSVQDFASGSMPSTLADLKSIPVVGPGLDWLGEHFGISLSQLRGWAIEVARTVLGPLGTLGRAAFLGALGTVVGFLVMVFVLFFAIRDGDAMFATVRELVPISEREKARLFRHLGGVTRAMVYGTGVTALVQGALVGIGFAVAGLPSPVVFGVLAALFALVPMAGTPVVWVPAVIYLAVEERWTAAALFLGWGIFVVLIDNFLRPMLVSGRAEIGTLTVFIGILGGVAAFGPIGIFLGPLLIALAVALVRYRLDREAVSPP